MNAVGFQGAPRQLKDRNYSLLKKMESGPHLVEKASLRAGRSVQGTMEGDWVFPASFSRTNVIPFVVTRMLPATCMCFSIYRTPIEQLLLCPVQRFRK